MISLNDCIFSLKLASTSIDELKYLLGNANIVYNKFTVEEPRFLVSLKVVTFQSNGSAKSNLIKLVSRLCGGGSKMCARRTESKSPKSVVVNNILHWNAESLNVAYAQKTFDKALQDWHKPNPFSEKVAYIPVVRTAFYYRGSFYSCSHKLTQFICNKQMDVNAVLLGCYKWGFLHMHGGILPSRATIAKIVVVENS